MKLSEAWALFCKPDEIRKNTMLSENAHDAIHDAEMTMELYKVIIEFQNIHSETFLKWGVVELDVNAWMAFLERKLSEMGGPLGRKTNKLQELLHIIGSENHCKEMNPRH